MAKAIKVENLSKAYQIGQFSTGTLSRDIERWWALARGKEDPFLKIGEKNDRATKGDSDIVWSLKDINFEVEKGDVLGIIGKNGAGKSTLLKVLSQVTTPTSGIIKIKGRIASLLEVGTGFHPELTGRENIFLNGAILGMTKAEIARKFDEIVDFSGVERYIDTPVKRYSSGMYVRLAFAVAAHLESEILVVDEVLAVGDAEFQKKCIGKMGDISKGEGRTILFVSHILNMIKSLCKNTIYLEDGTVHSIGETDDIIQQYLSSKKNTYMEFQPGEVGDNVVELLSARILDENNIETKSIDFTEDLNIEFTYRVKESGYRLDPNIHVFDQNGNYVFVASDHWSKKVYEKGVFTSVTKLPGSFLNEGIYSIGIGLTSYPGTVVHILQRDVVAFEITEDVTKRKMDFMRKMPGVVRPELEWETFKRNNL